MSTKHLGLLITLFLLSTGTSFAQYYHYNKGEKFLDIEWYDSAFREYVEGMNSGEPSSAMMVAWCYLNEKGTPRNINKGVAILEQWAEKDPTVCLMTAIFYDSTKSAANVYWGDDDFQKQVPRVDAALGSNTGIYTIYGRNPLFAEKYGLSFDIDKAIKYAEKLKKRVNVRATRDYVDLLNQGKIQSSGNKFALLSSLRSDNSLDRSGNNYRRVLMEAFEECVSLEDISSVISMDLSKRALLLNAASSICGGHYLMYEEDCYTVLTNKCLSIYKSIHEEYDGDREALLNLYNDEPQIRQALDIGLSVAAYLKGWREDNIEEVKWLCNNTPFKYANDNAKTVWTRRLLKHYVMNHMSWASYEELFASPYYIELDGINPFPEGYIQQASETYRLLVEYKERYEKTRDNSDYFSMLDFERKIQLLDESIKNKKWGEITTRKEVYLPIHEQELPYFTSRLQGTVTEIKKKWEEYLKYRKRDSEYGRPNSNAIPVGYVAEKDPTLFNLSKDLFEQIACFIQIYPDQASAIVDVTEFAEQSSAFFSALGFYRGANGETKYNSPKSQQLNEYLQRYPNSYYDDYAQQLFKSTLATEQDTAAFMAAYNLRSSSTKDEIKAVQKMPMSDTMALLVKEMCKKSYIKKHESYIEADKDRDFMEQTISLLK